jgi:uncharacterized protein YidB (DUF937 family)
MSMFDSLLNCLTGKSEKAGGQPLAGALSSVLTQNGGLDGLMNKFSQGGLGDVFSSGVGMGQNKPGSASQVQNILGSDHVKAIAAQLGVDPAKASSFLAEYLPKIIDKQTPSGKVDAGAEPQGGLAALLPSLLASVTGQRAQA